MILASCIDSSAGPGAKGAHAVISLAEGGIRFALPSSSLVSVSSSTRSGLRTVPALRAYMPRTALVEGSSYTLQGLIAWKDVIRSLEMQYAPPGSWEVSSITKTYTAHPAHLLFRQVLLFVVGQLSLHSQTNVLNTLVRAPICTPKQSEDVNIPHIVITPPPPPALSHQDFINTAPTPQDAAFGNQLIIPDPEFTVINCWKTLVDPSACSFKVDEFGSVPDDPYGGFGGCPSPSWGDSEDPDDVIEFPSWEERESDDTSDTSTLGLGLGPTWSG